MSKSCEEELERSGNPSDSSMTPSSLDENELIHPLMLPVVLMRLFKYFNLSEYRELRLVCKQWFALTKTRFRNGMRVKIPNKMLEGPTWDYLETEKRFEWNGEHPERRYHSFLLQRWQICSSPQKSSLLCPGSSEEMFKNMNAFWSMYGHCIRVLRLERCEVFCVKALKKAIFEDTPNLAELTLFSLENKTGGSDEEREGEREGDVVGVNKNLKTLIIKLDERFRFPITWRLLFSHFPEIERLELKNFYFKCDIPELVDSLEKLSHDKGHKWQIRDFKLEKVTFRGGAHFRKLVLLPQFNLETFHFESSGCDGEEMSVLPAALERHGDTLKKLHVENHNSGNPEETKPYENFPLKCTTFPSLTELILEGYVARNLHFLNKFPNLHTLRMRQHFTERTLGGTDLQKMGVVKLPFLKELEFVVDLVEDYYLPEDGMEMLTKVMPNLRSLKAQLDNFSFRVVCRKLKQLKKLEICTNWQRKIDDEGLTGIVAGRAEGEERLANITDLKELEHLSISQWGNVGDSSVFSGFLQMTKLRTLDVRLTSETSDIAFTALLERFPHSSSITRRPPSNRRHPSAT